MNGITFRKNGLSYTVKLSILFASFVTATITVVAILYARLRIIPYDDLHGITAPVWTQGGTMMTIWVIWAISSLMVVIMLLFTLTSNKQAEV